MKDFSSALALVGASATGPVLSWLAMAADAPAVAGQLASAGGIGILAYVLYHLYTSALRDHRADLAAERALREASHRENAQHLDRLADALERLTERIANVRTSTLSDEG